MGFSFNELLFKTTFLLVLLMVISLINADIMNKINNGIELVKDEIFVILIYSLIFLFIIVIFTNSKIRENAGKTTQKIFDYQQKIMDRFLK